MRKLKHFWIDFVRFSPRRFTLGCFLSILSTATSGIGLLLLIPLLQLSNWIPGEMPHNRYTPLVTHFFSTLGKHNALFIVIRQNLYKRIAWTRWSHMAMQPAANIEQMMSSGLDQITQLTHATLRFVSDLLLTVGYLLLSCTISLPMTALTILISATGLWISKSRNVYASGAQYFRLSRYLHEALSRFLDGMKFAKSNNGVSAYLDTFERLGKENADIQFIATDDQQRARLTFRFISIFVLSILLLTALLLFELSVPSLITLLILYSRLLPRIQYLQQSYLQMSSHAPAFDQYTIISRDFQANEETGSPECLSANTHGHFSQLFSFHREILL